MANARNLITQKTMIIWCQLPMSTYISIFKHVYRMKFKVQYCYKHSWYLLGCINSWFFPNCKCTLMYNVLFQKITKILKKLMACLLHNPIELLFIDFTITCRKMNNFGKKLSGKVNIVTTISSFITWTKYCLFISINWQQFGTIYYFNEFGV